MVSWRWMMVCWRLPSESSLNDRLLLCWLSRSICEIYTCPSESQRKRALIVVLSGGIRWGVSCSMWIESRWCVTWLVVVFGVVQLISVVRITNKNSAFFILLKVFYRIYRVYRDNRVYRYYSLITMFSARVRAMAWASCSKWEK